MLTVGTKNKRQNRAELAISMAVKNLGGKKRKVDLNVYG